MTDEFRIVIVKTGRFLFGRWRWAVEEKRVGGGGWVLKRDGVAFTRAIAGNLAMAACSVSFFDAERIEASVITRYRRVEARPDKPSPLPPELLESEAER